MPKYYCDYCDTFLTHDSPSVRKTHCAGRSHKEYVRQYYQVWLEEQVEKLVQHTSEAYKQGKLPSQLYGAPLGMPPPGLGFPPRYPVLGVPPGFRPPMVPHQGMMMPPRPDGSWPQPGMPMPAYGAMPK